MCLPAAGAAYGDEIPAGPTGYQSKVAPFFKTHCVQCHGPKKSKGKLTLHSLNGDLSLGQQLEKWESILEMLDSGEMPPAQQPQPTKAETEAVVKWIESGIRDYVKTVSQTQAEPMTRRLTNVEYENTLSELLGFELNVIDDLPEDPEDLYHFNNTAELMRMGPEQLSRYLEIARSAMQSAIVDPGTPEVFKFRREWGMGGNDKGMGRDEIGVWGNNRGSVAEGLTFSGFPKHGEYRIRMQASAILPPGYVETALQLQMGTSPGRTETPFKIIDTLHLTNSPDAPQVFEFTGRIENHPSAPAPARKNGPLVDQMALRPRVIFDDGTLNDGGTYANVRALGMPRAVINWIEIQAPVIDVWPPRHHTAILFESPLRESNPDAYIRELLTRFISRAYRRPATVPEVDKFATIYGLISPSVEYMEEAVRETLAMVLISPQFLYHTESAAPTDKHYAMASRLSYFLCASMPDQELIDLAAGGKLDDPAVIEQQVLRLLADRSQDFVENFTMQWLSIGKTKTVPINKDLFPRFLHVVPNGETAGTEQPYRVKVRDYMLKETVGFFGEMIRRNASVFNVVDSDFAYLNERLAAHYGVEGVQGEKMRAVPIKVEHNIGGLLTQGAILIGNGTGTAPHPIYRAVFLREAILGDTVAPPPSDVPALTDTAGESLEKAQSIAELLARHRTVESCNDCHFRLDPWGIPFEDYNAIGKFQPKVPKAGIRVSRFDAKKHKDLAGYQAYIDQINIVDVDATARVPHGPKVDGMRELKSFLLKNRRDDIAENMIRRLLSYSLGRHLTFRDRSAVETLFDQAQDNDFQVRDIIVAICQSDVFKDAVPMKEN